MRPRSGLSSPATMLTIEALARARTGRTVPVTPSGAVELRLEREVAQLLFDVDAQHVSSPCRRVPARRASHSDAISATSEMTTAMIDEPRRGGVARPAICVSV